MYGESQVVALPPGTGSGGLVYPLPGGEVTEIEALCFTLTTSNAVANRQVIARLQDALGVDTFCVPAAGTQAASLSVVYSFAPLVPSGGSSALGFMFGPFSRARSGDNLTVVVTVVNGAAGDTIHDARLTVCQYQRVPDYPDVALAD